MSIKFGKSDIRIVQEAKKIYCYRNSMVTNLDSVDLLFENLCRSDCTVERLFMIFHPSQFDLLNRTFKFLSKGCPKKVYVANSTVKVKVEAPNRKCKWPKYFDSLNVPSSLGGWRPLTSADIASLRVSATDSKSKSFLACVRKHPAYKHAKFITNLDEQALGEVIREIVDPRHLLSLFFPHTGSAIGVLKHMNLVDCKDEEDFKRSCTLVSRCWKNGKPNPDDPGSFLLNFLKMGMEEVIVNRLFVNFLVMGWLDAVSITHKGHLFIPSYFFNQRVAEAYTKSL